jgi:hypothetical protein
LLLFPKQYSITTIYIAFTLHSVLDLKNRGDGIGYMKYYAILCEGAEILRFLASEGDPATNSPHLH